MRRHLLCRISSLTIILIASLWSITGDAFVVGIDEFSIIRNGTGFFDDTFSDGVAPPDGPNGDATYAVVGTIPRTAESGGFLQLDSANGAVAFNAIGQVRMLLRTRLLTSINPTDLGAGLKSDDTLVLTGIFSLTTPSGVFNPQYGIRFNDAGPGSNNQILQLQVRFDTVNGLPDIRYILEDFDAHTVTVLGSAPFAPPSGADEILLRISRPDTTNDNFFGSFSYLNNGSVVGGTTFSTPGLGFQGESFVRAEFTISDGFVPEPTTLALLGLGLAGLGFGRRKNKKA